MQELTLDSSAVIKEYISASDRTNNEQIGYFRSASPLQCGARVDESPRMCAPGFITVWTDWRGIHERRLRSKNRPSDCRRIGGYLRLAGD